MFSKFASALKRRFLNPPSYLLDVAANLRAVIAQDYREILLIDIIILSFLIASIHQVAFVFGKGAITTVAILKSIGIDGAIWVLCRVVSKRIFSVKDAKGKSVGAGFLTKFFLWVGILVFVILTTITNTLFELWDYTAPSGEIQFYTNDTKLVLFTKTISSSFMAVIIVFLTFVRAILTKNMIDSFQTLRDSENKELKKKKTKVIVRRKKPVLKKRKR